MFLNANRVATALLPLLSCHGSRLSRIHVDPVSGEFVDELGRIRLFHGINSVVKGVPWYDEKILDPGKYFPRDILCSN